MAIYNPKAQPSTLFRIPVPDPPAKARVLFVHGAWHGAWVWERWQRAFAKRGYETYAVDLPGHGTRRSDGWIWRAGIRDHVECVREALEEIGDAILIGHSMGAFVIMKHLEEAEAPAAVLVAPVPHTGFPLGNLLKLGKVQPSALVKFLFSLPVAWRSEDAVRRLFFSDDVDKATVRRAFQEMGPESARTGMQLTLTMKTHPKRITTQTLVLHAADDVLFNRDKSEALATALPNGELKVLDSVAHDVPLDTHWEVGARTVCDWLDQVGARTEPPKLSEPPLWKHAHGPRLIPPPKAEVAPPLPPKPPLVRPMIHRPEDKA